MYMEGFINFPAFPKVFGTGTKEVNMNRRVFFISAFCFLLFAFGLSAQDTLEEIITIENPWQNYQFSFYIKEGSGDVNGDGYSDFIVTKNDNYYPTSVIDGEVLLYLGKQNLTDIPDYTLTGLDNDSFGFTASLAGDINGDGYNDVIISAIYADPASAGAVYIYLGGNPFDTDVDYVLNGSNYANVLYVNFHYGCYLSAAADFNNDGFNDLVIGGNGPDMSWEGQIDVFLGGDPFDTESDFCLYGQNYFDGYGKFITGDLNGDGYDDFLPGHLENNEYILEIYPGCEDFPPEVAIATLNMDSFGYNGHRILCNNLLSNEADIILYTHTLPSNDKYLNLMYFNADFSVEVIDSINCEYDNPGIATNLFCSDINNDSANDIVISFERDYFPHYAGKTMIFYTGALFDTIPDIIMTGSVNHEYFGSVGYDLGDVNGDGNTDILLGSSTYPIGTITDYVTIYTEENLVSAQNETISISNKFYNYPNPFNPITTICFDLPVNIENPVIEIFNIKGEKIRTLCAFPYGSLGTSSVVWDGTDNNRNPVSSGVYLYRIKTDEGVSISKKMLLLK